MLSISACSDSSLLPTVQKQSKKQAISKIDGKPILKVKAADLYNTHLFDKVRDKLASKDGRVILHALKEKASSLQKPQTPSVAVMNLKNYAQQVVAGNRAGGGQAVGGAVNSADIGSELQVQDADGQTEDFVLTLQPYNPQPARESSKQVVAGMAAGKANVAPDKDTYLALDPDFFYLQDNKNGKEDWPVTFPAVSLTDSAQKIMVTISKDSHGQYKYKFDYSGTSNGNTLSTANTEDSQPNLVFLTPTPVVHPGFMKPNPPHYPPGGGGTGGGGSGGPAPCTNVSGRGGPTGKKNDPNYHYPQYETFFAVKAIRLYKSGDGDGASELQMFVEQNDNYNKCFPRKYKYRFDKVRRNNPITSIHGVIPRRNTIIKGADSFDGLNPYYQVPDVDNAGHTYKFDNITAWIFQLPPVPTNPGYYQKTEANYFPLFNLTTQPGPWRLVFSDTDHDYPHFSERRRSHWSQNIQTYDMNTGTWSSKNTGFTVKERHHGSSDDPIPGSGVRNITYDNVQAQANNDGVVMALKQFFDGSSMYKFTLVNENILYSDEPPNFHLPLQ